jgi:transcriptional regulator with XRE-family HTH domain
MPARGESAETQAGDGPRVRTPLSSFFYDAWKKSGLTLEMIARRSKLSVPTVWAYLNGTRGAGRQRRQRPTLTALAQALQLDVETTLDLAGVSVDAGVIKAIEADASLSRRSRSLLVAMYEQMRRE